MCLCREVRSKVTYLTYNQNISVLNEYNKICTMTTHHSKYGKYFGKKKKKKLKHLKLLFCNKQKVFSKDRESDIKARSIIEELLAEHSKCFSDREFILII